MTSKINSGAVDGYAALTRPAPAGSRTPARTASSAATATDSVSLTRDSLLLQQAADAVSASSGFDTARVASVSAELHNGTYRVDPQAIAAKMMKTEWELYG
jgi:negative regulator of flagellin synthesis FlgM